MTSQAILEQRQPDAAVDNRFVERVSHYAFDPRPIETPVLDSLFEAARWAPSSFNEQPWRFHVVTRGAGRDRLNEAIMAGNRTWSDQAPVIVFVVAKTSFSQHSYAAKMGLAGQPNRHAWFDTGAAAMQMVMQAHELGLATHAMGGIDAELAHALLELDDEHAVVCAYAVGYPGDPADLPDGLRARATGGPSKRLPAQDLVFVAST